ncbi:hypothetical protein [Chitinilyticum aquatile]|uniref:hypothetical protein n=1 Tax=Chitinilyticum aquatile TaxID=362520 RepID=UPI000420BC2B|nr:hypothetical protein [Chitinilyticum aquatile]
MSLDTQVQLPGNLVFIKTSKGQEEIDARSHGLPQRLRRLLILVDGAKSVGALAALLVGLEVVPLLRELETAGFVMPAGIDPHSERAPVSGLASPPIATDSLAAAPPATAPIPAAAAVAVEPAALSEHRIRMIRMLMQESCELYLGIFGKGLLPEIAGIDSEAALRKVFGRWHIAMRESHQSDAQALALVDEIRTLMRF